MNWADWTILSIIIVSCLIGLKRGFVKEALSLAVWVLALFVALSFKDSFSVVLQSHVPTPSMRDMASFGILFTLTLVVGAMGNYLISEIVRMTGLSGTDRVFGMVFGLARGFVIVMANLLFVPPIISVDKDTWWVESQLIPNFLAFEDWFRGLMGTTFELFSRLF